MQVTTKELTISRRDTLPLRYLHNAVYSRLGIYYEPIRFVITYSDFEKWCCEVDVVSKCERLRRSIFSFEERDYENTENFNVVLIVPTGIGAEIGGHAGDATPVARLIGSMCDTLITHPNVVNASDINEIPSNSLYVEGSIITRLLMGMIELQPVRSNRVLVIIHDHEESYFTDAAINAVNGARASYGLNCSSIVCLNRSARMGAHFSRCGRAIGFIENLEQICDIFCDHADKYDAVAISSIIDVPYEYHHSYFQAAGEMVNPWGGVEAMLTHTLSSLYNVPTAHSPMFETTEIANMNPGIVDSRMAAEAVSITFLQCILKGLMQSPRIVTDEDTYPPGTIGVTDVSCLVIPDGCLGLPTFAALEQGIPVIAVKENKNVMKNDLSTLPWASGQFYCVENYWEAVGVLASLKAGVSPELVRRPLKTAILERKSNEL